MVIYENKLKANKKFYYVIKILCNICSRVAMIDLDEFLYSPIEVDVRKILKQHEPLALVGLNWVWFGSNGYEKQPASVISSFTRRADYDIFRYTALVGKNIPFGCVILVNLMIVFIIISVFSLTIIPVFSFCRLL